MATSLTTDQPLWFVLNHLPASPRDTARKSIDRFNSWQGQNLELFAPAYVVREQKNGITRLRSIRLTFHYVFVCGTLSQVKNLCAQNNGFSFLLRRGSAERYATIPDAEMQHFKNIARAYENSLPYFPLDDIDLEEGDLVEVVNGAFPGLVGRYMPRPKSNSGNIILHVYNNVGTIAFDVKATDVRVIEFSRKSTRANDQIDAFVPYLLDSLLLFHKQQPLSTTLLTKLTVFTRRMGIVKLPSRKLNAKLQILLYGSYTLLGDVYAAKEARTNFQQLSPAITNPSTRLLSDLILYLLNPSSTPDDLFNLLSTASSLTSSSLTASQRHLISIINSL